MTNIEFTISHDDIDTKQSLRKKTADKKRKRAAVRDKGKDGNQLELLPTEG